MLMLKLDGRKFPDASSVPGEEGKMELILTRLVKILTETLLCIFFFFSMSVYDIDNRALQQDLSNRPDICHDYHE